MTRTLHRPEPFVRHTAAPIDASTPARQAATRLRDGELLIVTDRYGTGAEVIAELTKLLRPPPATASYAKRLTFRKTFREASLRLLAPIERHRLALEDARDIGFLAQLYPELQAFALPYVQVQELHGAWYRYQQGTHLAVLGHAVHPYFGTYVPTRVVHLELFATWLSQYQGARSRAVDVGTGCGVLALMLAKAGFDRVLATDINPNAIESLERELSHLPSKPPIAARVADLFGEDERPADLIVFNPPWIQGESDGLLDQALYYEDPGLFERFFEQAHARLAPSGRIVVVFSNVMTLLQPEVPHPILTELERGRLKLVQKMRRKVKPTPNEAGQRRRTKERVEIWELETA